jgi:predicted PurR-regulated permease PerM
MCLLIVVLIIGPFAYLFAVLVNEAAMAVAKVNAMYQSGQLDEFLSFEIPWLKALTEKLSQYFDVSQFNIENMIKQVADNVGQFLFSQTGWLISNGTRFVFYFGLMIFTMYYFFKDGETVVKQIKTLVPLSKEQVNRIFKQLREVIYATMYGGVVVALLQGLLGGILFAIFGISSPVFWGAVMALLSIIPFVGAFVIYIPAGMILIFSGSYVKGILVIALGTIIVSQVDNVVRPLLVSGKTSMHPLLLFFSMLGGVALFGLLGIVLGPLIAAVFVTLLQILELKLHSGTDDAT